MVNINISKISSKGQVVIPKEMRSHFKEGDDIVFIEDGNRIILKNKEDLSENFKEDLDFAKRTEEAYQRIKSGNGIEKDFDDFIGDMKSW